MTQWRRCMQRRGVMMVAADPLWSYEITFGPRPRSVAAVRRFVQGHLDFHQLPMLVDDISLVATELATNALNHCGTPFAVTLTAFADHIILAVRDGSASWPIRVHAQPDAAAGRGMAIVDVVSRDWGVVLERGVGKTVWAAFDVG